MPFALWSHQGSYAEQVDKTGIKSNDQRRMRSRKAAWFGSQWPRWFVKKSRRKFRQKRPAVRYLYLL